MMDVEQNSFSSIIQLHLLDYWLLWGKEHLVWFLHDPGMLLSSLVVTVEGLFLYVIYTYKYVFQKPQTSSCPLKYNRLKYCLNLILGVGWQKWGWICLLPKRAVKTSNLEFCEQNPSHAANDSLQGESLQRRWGNLRWW